VAEPFCALTRIRSAESRGDRNEKAPGPRTDAHHRAAVPMSCTVADTANAAIPLANAVFPTGLVAGFGRSSAHPLNMSGPSPAAWHTRRLRESIGPAGMTERQAMTSHHQSRAWSCRQPPSAPRHDRIGRAELIGFIARRFEGTRAVGFRRSGKRTSTHLQREAARADTALYFLGALAEKEVGARLISLKVLEDAITGLRDSRF